MFEDFPGERSMRPSSAFRSACRSAVPQLANIYNICDLPPPGSSFGLSVSGGIRIAILVPLAIGRQAVCWRVCSSTESLYRCNVYARESLTQVAEVTPAITQNQTRYTRVSSELRFFNIFFCSFLFNPIHSIHSVDEKLHFPVDIGEFLFWEYNATQRFGEIALYSAS